MKPLHTRSRGLLGLAACLLLWAWPTTAAAQDPVRRTELVYGVNAYIGGRYEGDFYPSSVDTIYLVANAVSVVSSRRTEVYYWPITNREVADWARLNEPVEGVLEIRRRGRLVAGIEATDYVVQYPEGQDLSEAVVYLGEEAHRQWDHFEASRREFRERVSAYYNDLVTYRQDLDDRIEAGTLEGEPDPPPMEPEPFLYSSTEVNRGFPVTLPPGSYTLQVRAADGQVPPGSHRQLKVFEPLSEGVAMWVIPHDRYTFPEKSDDEGEVIYLRRGTIAYLQPHAQEEYRDIHLTRLLDPQDTSGRPDLYQWLQTDEIQDGVLVVTQGNRVIARVERRSYAVRQITGAALGYEIHDQATTDLERLRERRPDFQGYPVDTHALPASFRVHLEDADGRPVPGSRRRVRVVRADSEPWLAVLPYAPVVLALVLAGSRRRRFVRLPRDQE